MTEKAHVPGPGRDMAMHNDWWASGGEHVLPRQGFPLTMLIGTACQPGFTGSLDDLVHEIFDGLWDMIGGDLDGALTFSWPDEEWDYEAAPDGREACEAARWERFSAMLTSAGFPVPTTVRDLSELYLTWGLAGREETPDGTRWSMPAALPLPSDLLPWAPSSLSASTRSAGRCAPARSSVGEWRRHLRSDAEMDLVRSWMRRVECPTCKAAAGRACRTAGGRPANEHRARRDAVGPVPYAKWRKAGLIPEQRTYTIPAVLKESEKARADFNVDTALADGVAVVRMFLADRLGLFLQGEEAMDRIDDAVRKLIEVRGWVGAADVVTVLAS